MIISTAVRILNASPDLTEAEKFGDDNVLGQQNNMRFDDSCLMIPLLRTKWSIKNGCRFRCLIGEFKKKFIPRNSDSFSTIL